MKKGKSTPKKPEQPHQMAAYLFHQGTNFLAYEYLGLHFEGERVVFRVWAPNADGVSVCGDFNGWNNQADCMTRITEAGVWELSLPQDRVAMGQTIGTVSSSASCEISLPSHLHFAIKERKEWIDPLKLANQP